jgi:hypothetical protein
MTQRFVKKVGDPHPATIQVDLTDAQRAERRRQACDLRDQQAALVEEKKLAMAGFNHRKKSLENLEAVARGQASTGIEEVAVVVQDYLTAGNEVVSVRIDTQDPVARRTATTEELQEELFGGSEDEDKPH